MHVGFTGWLGQALAYWYHTRGQNGNHPRHSSLPRAHTGRLCVKFLKNPSSAIFKTAKYAKCLNTASAIMSAVLIISMCGIPIRWPTTGLKFWPGYLRSSPGYGTRTFGPGGSTRWEAGFYKLRNIRVGLVVFVLVRLMGQPCFATEVRGLARPSSGERRFSGKERYC